MHAAPPSPERVRVSLVHTRSASSEARTCLVFLDEFDCKLDPIRLGLRVNLVIGLLASVARMDPRSISSISPLPLAITEPDAHDHA